MLGAEKAGAARNRVPGDRVAVKDLAPNAEKALGRGTVRDSDVRPGGKVLRGLRSLIGKVVADGVRAKALIVRGGKARTTVRECVKGLARSAEKAWRLVRKPVSPMKSRVGGLAAVKGSVREVGKDVLRVPKVR